jgi:hypothetical protein
MYWLKMIFTDDCDPKNCNITIRPVLKTKILEFQWDYIVNTEIYAHRNFADPNIVHIKGCRLIRHNGY